MSASSKKKLRKENAAAQMTEKQQKELSEAKKLKRMTVTFVALMLVVAVSAGTILVVRGVNNSGVLEKKMNLFNRILNKAESQWFSALFYCFQ